MSGPKPQSGIMGIQPYVAGDSDVAGTGRVIKLASNENPLGASPNAIAAYRAEADSLHLYPDGGGDRLRAAIGGRYDLDPARIVCGAGSDELLSLLAQAYAGPGDEVIHTEHGFAMYPINARAVGATPVVAPETNLTSDVDAIIDKVTPRTRIVFIANPNNPTGSYLPAEAMARLCAALPDDALLVIDAAYAEYVTQNDYEPGIELVDSHANVVMTRTFSKIHGLAALRLGWAYCPPHVVDVLNRVRGPFNVNTPAQAAGVAAIEDVDFVDRARRHNTQWLAWLTDQLRALGLEVPPSAGNFILVRFPDDPAKNADQARAFLNGQGILPRQMGGYGLPDSLRITIGLEDDNRAVAAALTAFLA